jgi:GNAT superfamily N-acetyltransferase
VRHASPRRKSRTTSAKPAPAPGGITVRPVRPADLQQVVALDAAITGVAKPGYWKRLIERTSRAGLSEVHFLVAEGLLERDTGLLGFTEGEVRAWEFGSAPCGWVYVLSVQPDARLQGVGQLLLDALTAAFKRAGVTRMRTMVLRSDRLVMQFFRAAGMMAGPYLELEKELE